MGFLSNSILKAYSNAKEQAQALGAYVEGCSDQYTYLNIEKLNAEYDWVESRAARSVNACKVMFIASLVIWFSAVIFAIASSYKKCTEDNEV